MASKLDALVLQNKNVVERMPFGPTVASRFLLWRRPVQLMDIQFETKYANSYALISEKNSERFAKVMDRLVRYIGAGPIGPKKYWEYPWVATNLRLESGMSVLDAGCGRAPLQFFLCDIGCRVTGIDPYEDMQWHGIRRSLPKRYGCSIEYRREGIDRIGLEDGAFDRVCCVSVMEHCRALKVEDEKQTAQTAEDRVLQRRMMQELLRVLKPCGLLVVTVDVNLPRSDCLPESNVDVANLIEVEGADLHGPRCPEPLPGEEGFNAEYLIRNANIDISNYCDTLQTSIGFVLRKRDA